MAKASSGIEHAAILRIKSDLLQFDFLLAGGNAGETPLAIHNYGVNWTELPASRYSEIPQDSPTGQGYLLWDGGKSQPVTLTLKLVVGASLNIDTPDDLLYITEYLASLAYGQGDVGGGGGLGAGVGTQEAPRIIDIQVGQWFRRHALVKSLNVAFGRPWDPETGKPYVAEVRMELQYIYSKVPESDNFHWDEG